MAQITIQSGDTLSKLASKYGTTVSQLMSANPTVKNANLIIAGRPLNIPDKPTSVTAPRTLTPPTSSVPDTMKTSTLFSSAGPLAGPMTPTPTGASRGLQYFDQANAAFLGGASSNPLSAPSQPATQSTTSTRSLTIPQPAPQAPSTTGVSSPTAQTPGLGLSSPQSGQQPASSTSSGSSSSSQSNSFGGNTELNSLYVQTLKAMMQAAQGTGDADLEAKRNAIIMARFNSQRAPTADELRVLSPDAQAGLRGLDTKGLETQLGGVNAALTARQTARSEQQTANEKLLNFFTQQQQLAQNQQQFDAKQNAPVELGQGSTLYDPKTGQPLYTAPISQSSSEPTSHKEWELAGSPGTYADWLKKGLTGDMTSQQVANFNHVVDNYQKSPLIKANDRVIVLKTISDQLKKDPTNSSLQVSFIYSLIQALDTYQSSVREGEIGLVSGTQGLLDKLQNIPNQISGGSVLGPETVNRYLDTAKVLTDSIAAAAQQKQQQFTSQATVSGVGDAWNQYLSGVTGGFQQQGQSQGQNQSDPFGVRGFSSEGSVSVNAQSQEVQSLASAIGQFESQGNYQIRGPVVPSGIYAGQQALGKYQIMPGNLPAWSQEALGYQVTPQQFLQSPEIQDAIAHSRIAMLYNQYQNPQDVASIWFTGQPVSKNNNASDVLGTTASQYVGGVTSNLKRFA